MRVLVTRDAATAKRSAARLAAAGHEAVVLPLVAYRDRPFVIPPGPHAAIAFTSARAPGALLRGTALDASDLLPLPCYCVGPETIAAARRAGFSRVMVGEGDAAALAARIARDRPGPMLYPSAENRAFDLAAALGAAGIAVDEIAVYGADLPDPGAAAFRAALAQCDGGAALLYSRRTALQLVALAARHERVGRLAALRLIAISPAVASAMPAPLRGSIRVAATPDEPAMLAALDAAGATQT